MSIGTWVKLGAILALAAALYGLYLRVEMGGETKGRAKQKADDAKVIKTRDEDIGRLSATLSMQSQAVAKVAEEGRLRLAESEAARLAAEKKLVGAQAKAAAILKIQPSGDVCASACSLLRSD